MITGIILSGGLSSRMGRDKGTMQLPYTTTTYIEHLYDLTIGVTESTYISINATQRDVYQQLLPYNTFLIEDLYPQQGPLGGIFSVYHSTPSSDGYVIIPCDMPWLTKTIMSRLIKEYDSRQGNRSVHYYSDQRDYLLPCIISRSTIQQFIEHHLDEKWSIYHLLSKSEIIKLYTADDHLFENQNTAL